MTVFANTATWNGMIAGLRSWSIPGTGDSILGIGYSVSGVRGSAVLRQLPHTQYQMSNTHDHEVVLRIEGKADEAEPGNNKLRSLWITKAEDAAPAPVRSHCVKMTFDIERQALRPAKTREEPVHFAVRRNPIDVIEARCG